MFIKIYGSIVNCQKRSVLTVKREPLRGFTLMELLLVFSVVGILSSITIASFSSYNNNKTLEMSSTQVKDMLQLAQHQSLSQVKPPECLDERLLGYEVAIDSDLNQYKLSAICDSSHSIEVKKLPKDVFFRSDSSKNVFFPVLTGNPSSIGVIILEGYGTSYSLTVDTSGSISQVKDAVPTNVSVEPTPTGTACPWYEWWMCTDGLSPVPTQP